MLRKLMLLLRAIRLDLKLKIAEQEEREAEPAECEYLTWIELEPLSPLRCLRRRGTAPA